MRRSVLLLAVAASWGGGKVRAQNAELRTLEQEDQAVRTGHDAGITRTDADRVARVLALLGQGAVVSAEDAFNAALVLQHTPLELVGGKLQSMSPDNYLLAHYLALRALKQGYEGARQLVAQSIDRYLWMTRGYQMYGTNRTFDRRTGKEVLVPIDRSVPDSARAKYGVPPLKELLRRWPEQPWPDSAGLNGHRRGARGAS